MATEVWYRDPFSWIRDAEAEGIDRYLLSKSELAHRKMDPIAYMRQQFAHSTIRPEFMVSGREGAALYDIFSHVDQPKAFWPRWDMTLDPLDDLVGLLGSPVGLDQDICTDELTPTSLRPVFGQEHRVIIGNVPNQLLNVNKAFMRNVVSVCQEFPDAKIHINGSSTFSVVFGLGFASCDLQPRQMAMTQLRAPNGIAMNQNHPEEYARFTPWINLLGMTLADLKELRARIVYQIRAIEWAKKYYTSDLRVKSKYKPNLAEASVSEAAFRYQPARRVQFNNKLTVAKKSVGLKSAPGYEDTDYVLCNGCIFRTSCKLARDGFVCTAGGSKVEDLAKHFGTRSADRIIDGLGKLLELQATRVEVAAAEEQAEGETNPEVTRQINSLFANGVKLAKLIDPSLNGKGVEVNIGVGTGGNATVVASSDPRQMVAGAIRALEDAGVPRADITSDMITGLLTNMAHGSAREAIEAKVIEHEEKK